MNTTMREVTPAENVADDRTRQPPHPSALLTGALAGAATLGTVWFLAGRGLWALVPLVAVWVLLPTTTRLDRRLAINICATLGVGAFLAWVPAVVTSALGQIPSRGALALSLTAGFIGWSARRKGLRSTLPRASAADALIPFVAVAAAVVAAPMAFPTSPAAAFGMLTDVTTTSGWDHASHFSMFLAQRESGVAPPLAQLLGHEGSRFFGPYPQQFHGVLATLAGLVWGDSPASVAVELVRYTQLQAVLFVVLAAAVTAIALQPLPRRAVFGRCCVAVSAAGLVVGFPGAHTLVQGHLSFLFACTATTALVLVCPAQRIDKTPSLILLWAALFYLVAQWPLLLPLAAVGSTRLLLATAMGRRRRSDALVVVVTAAFTAHTCWALLRPTESVGGQLGATGEVASPSVVALLGAPLLVVLLCWTSWRTPRTAPDRNTLFAVALTGLGMVLALGLFQILSFGELTYYFWKLGTGCVLVVLVCALPVVAGNLDRFAVPAGSANPLRLLVASAATVSVAALGLGFWAGLPSASLAVQTRTVLDDATTASSSSTTLLRAALSTPSPVATRTTVVWSDARRDPALSSQWFHTLSSARSATADRDDGALPRYGETSVEVLTTAALTALQTPGRLVLTNDPEVCRAVTAQSDEEVAGRCRLAPAR
ncbi:hypothetical protein ABEG17_03125 [Pedococcus sp. KACC 23699]|uniref:Uncharacterized protein n=1 Tax=Pedococcus sp. KACC 23699 TaxID=3149228 RepID=A0AAU7JV55_9MICO